MDKPQSKVARCRCGKVQVTVVGAPIMTVACYCHSCQDAARRLGLLPGAPALAEADGGTHFIMQRKDRVAWTHGKEHLREHKLSPSASTRRLLAGCCNSAMCLEFKGGHWLSLYKERFPQSDQPRIEARTMTQDCAPGVVFDDDIPSPKTHSLSFMWKLMRAWAAMGFKTPQAERTEGSIDA
jgi:hypothetical protein